MMSTTFASLTLLASLTATPYDTVPPVVVPVPVYHAAPCSTCYGPCLYPLTYPLNPAPYYSPYNAVYHWPTTGPVPPGKAKALYERLGGETAIKLVVDDLVARAAANPKVNFTRKGTPKEFKPTPENIDHLKKMLVDMIGAATGGPQKYTGKSMKDAHAGMKITQAEFDALAADLKATLDKFKVPAKEQQELMAIVASTAGDIVDKKRN